MLRQYTGVEDEQVKLSVLLQHEWSSSTVLNNMDASMSNLQNSTFVSSKTERACGNEKSTRMRERVQKDMLMLVQPRLKNA